MEDLDLPGQLKPLSLSKKAYKSYYGNFANGSLWPVFHGLQPRRVFDEEDWQIALGVVQQFADKIIELAEPDDYIWIHDFHLIMLPKLLREAGLRNRIGFFLHTPFSQPEVFQSLPHSREMIDSLRAADVCGFQTSNDAEGYSKSKEALGIKDEKRAPQLIGVYPVGIDYASYATAFQRDAVRKHSARIADLYGDKTIILSISRLDYTKGIVEQLRAVEEFLMQADNPRSYLYKLIVAPSRESLTEYQQLSQEIQATVTEINNRLASPGWVPIDYDNRAVPTDEVVAWFAKADVMLVTPQIDGMNLVAKEYIAAKIDNHGLLILSNSAGAAHQLKQALLVDPNNHSEIVSALRQANTMPQHERRKRFLAMRQNVRSEDAYFWGNKFSEDLETST